MAWARLLMASIFRSSSGQTGSGYGRETDKRFKVSQWRALVAIRTQHIKGGKAGIARFRSQGGLRPLLDLIKHPECSRKTLDLALSILANCCTELETRIETVLNRAARALGNLAMDPESSALIHSAGGVPLLLLCVSLSSAPSSPTAAPPKDASPKLECAQSAARALLYLSDTPSNRLSLLTQGTLSALAPLIAPEYPQELRRAALRTLHELTRSCGVECAREVSRSGVLAQLGVMALGESGKPFEDLALKTLANLCSQGCLRPLVGSLGVIQKFTEEVKRDPLKSAVFLKALCLCCKEAVNRAKVKESGGLEVLIGFLSAHQNHPLSRLTILACVDFVFDESAMELLQELGLVPLLVARLVELTRGEELSAEKMDVSLSSNTSPIEEQGSSSFLSLRSWLVSEGLISSEGDLLDSSSVDGDWASLQIPSSSSPQASSPNLYSSSSFHHPYHPEPWTPESPILLLLSRFSHSTDPSAALVSSGIMSGLLYYLTQHQDPSSRCFRMLCRLSCNPNCLQALVRTGSVALIRAALVLSPNLKSAYFTVLESFIHKARVLWLIKSVALLNNLRVQCESGFGSGVLAHVMLSGSDSDKMNCALSLPLISSNKSLLKKLLLDSGGLLLALQPLSCDDDDDADEDHPTECERLLSDLLNSPHSVLTQPVSSFGRVSPPPSKKPRLADICPYSVSNFDLLLLLDDGTRVPACREAVAGVEGTGGIRSEYFRALLRGGFGEAQGNSKETVHIKDVSSGMLLPVLHYLCGCRFTKGGEAVRSKEEGKRRGQCQILDKLVLHGLSLYEKETEEHSAENLDFQKTPLGEMMIGACRFLVSELQRDLEDLCVSFLLSCSAKVAHQTSTEANAEKDSSKMDHECPESAEETLANRTSELELTGFELQTEKTKKQNSTPQQTDSKKTVDKSVSPEEMTLRPKSLIKGSAKLLKSAAQGSRSSSDRFAEGGVLATLLPQVYWFSQCYSYPALGRVCLSLLLGCQDCPRPFLSSSIAGDCLRRLAREAHCTETLKQDLLSLVSVALS
uniref:Armadillo repeat containing 5 n=1 Tax=Amphilophus citrinellus TaxID=61819 RepID=A0A3Q0RIP3_AMPCI